jgi:chemotaxis regulatin CheY-phosphate phosphatase CheZ
MQKLIVSMVRFTTAVTLYGLEQIQTVSYLTQGGQDLFKVLDKFEIALDSLTEALVDNIDESKRDTLKSVANIAEEAVNRSFDSVDMIDPRRVLRMADKLWQKSSDAMTDWFGKSTPTNGSEPKPAAEVLS